MSPRDVSMARILRVLEIHPWFAHYAVTLLSQHCDLHDLLGVAEDLESLLRRPEAIRDHQAAALVRERFGN